MSDLDDLKNLFYAGRHQDVIDRFWGKETPPVHLIGSLCFLAKLDEAKILFERHDFNRKQTIQANFFLSIGEVRQSLYQDARNRLVKNFQTYRSQDLSDEESFYIFQGLAFYRYFCGRYYSCLKFSFLAYKAALATGLSYGVILSQDLYGHSLVTTGQIQKGLAILKQAQKNAENIGATGHARAIQVSVRNYKRHFGIKLEASEHILLEDFHDRYSLISIYLEDVCESFIQGNLSVGEEILDKAFAQIYQSGHKRYESLLNIRLAHSLFNRKKFAACLSVLTSVGNILDPKVDIDLIVKCLGLEFKVQKALGLADEAAKTFSKLKEMSLKCGSGEAMRHLKRIEPSLGGDIRPFEDLRGDLIDRAMDGRSSFSEISRAGDLSLLRHLRSDDQKGDVILLDLSPKSLTVFYDGEVHNAPEALTRLLRNTILAIARGEGSKQQLIEGIWGYTYNPLKHDQLVYNVIKQIRKALGRFEGLLSTEDFGYAFKIPVLGQDLKLPPSIAQPPSIDEPSYELNYRQIHCLETMVELMQTDVNTHSKQFDISRATATRDLTDLVKKGFLTTSGRARARKYHIPK